MAVANRTYEPDEVIDPAKVEDYVSDIGLLRFGNDPAVQFSITPSVVEMEADGLTPKTNSIGQLLRKHVGDAYQFRFEDPAALFDLQVRMLAFLLTKALPHLGVTRTPAEVTAIAQTMVNADEGPDAANTITAEQLRDEMLAWWDANPTADLDALQTQFGVARVGGDTPFRRA